MKAKRFLAALLTLLTLVGSLPCTAFAAGNSDENPDITSHTIVLTVPAADPDEEGIAPLMWDQKTPAGVGHNSFTTDPFYVSDPHFAFEASATAIGGASVNGSFSVTLMCHGGIKAYANGTANGTVYKVDWISMSSGDYYFLINNMSDYDLSFTITYYSW